MELIEEEKMKAKESESKLAILIPTLNEEQAIEKLVVKCTDITNNVYIVDGLSTDKTVERAKKAGAEIILCEEIGKGTALVQGFKRILEDNNVNFVAYIDGDNTYDPSDIKHIHELMKKESQYDMIIGNRFPKREKSTITRLNMLGNRFFSKLISILVKQKIVDSQSGLRIMSKDVLDFFTKSLKSKNFEIETEMIVKAAKEGYKIGEIPINFYKRDGDTKLNPFIDGFRILRTIFKSAVNKKT